MEFLTLLFWIILAAAVIIFVVLYLKSRKKGVKEAPEISTSEGPEETPPGPGI